MRSAARLINLLLWRKTMMNAFLLLSWVALIVVSYLAAVIVLKKTDLL
jgi:hypothetical protein